MTKSIAARLGEANENGQPTSVTEEELRLLLEAADIPFEHLGWDWYDNSVELYGVPADYRLSEDAQRIIHEAGFGLAYVNHKDNWETHHGWEPEFSVSKGFRVSYPHKRGDEDGSIWVEEFPVGWPQEWLDTGYVLIKKPV